MSSERTSPATDQQHPAGLLASRLEGRLGEGFERLTALARRIVGGRAACLGLAAGAREFLEYWWCPPDEWRGRAGCEPVARSLTGCVVSRRAPLVTADLQLDPALADIAPALGTAPLAVLAMPVFAPAGEAVGALCVVDDGPRAWSEHDASAVGELARAAEREILASLQQWPVPTGGLAPRALALWENEQTLELAESSAGIGIWDVDLATGFVRARPQFFRILGLEPTDGPVPIEIVRALRHPDDLRRVVSGFEQAVASGAENYEVEYRIRRPDGETRWIFGRGRVIRDARGSPVRYSGVDLDITERKRAEAALAATEQRYREVVDHANDLVATLDLDFRFLSVNPAVERILGYKSHEVIGTPLSLYVPEGQLELHRHMLERKIHGDPSTRYEMEFTGKSGERFTLEVNTKLARDAEGRPAAIHAIARDITERKHAEARQALLVRELQHRAKNLLAVVQSIVANTLRRSADPEAALEAIEGRLQALARAHDFVGAGPVGGVSIRELVAAELSTFPARATIEGPDIEAGSGFAQMFALVVHELATNAAKYGALSTPGGSVEIRWGVAGEPSREILQFRWVERGGPPVSQPAAHGFGTRLIATALTGSPRLVYDPRGLEFAIDVPLLQVIRDTRAA